MEQKTKMNWKLGSCRGCIGISKGHKTSPKNEDPRAIM